MRIITITVREENNGQNASIDVNHSNNGEESEIELAVVNLLDGYLFQKVNEITESEEEIKHSVVKNREESIVN